MDEWRARRPARDPLDLGGSYEKFFGTYWERMRATDSKCFGFTDRRWAMQSELSKLDALIRERRWSIDEYMEWVRAVPSPEEEKTKLIELSEKSWATMQENFTR